MSQPDRMENEVDFWGHRMMSLDECVAEFRSGMGANTRYAIDLLEPLAGQIVLDFACGQGITSCLLAARGAKVIGVDVTPQALNAASELAESLGLTVDFRCGDLLVMEDLPSVDRMFGRYALHHVDVEQYGRRLAQLLDRDGWGAFLETSVTNPALAFARRFGSGRLGVARYGSDDERPLSYGDIRTLRQTFGYARDVVPEVSFLRILDRNVLRRRSPALTSVCGFVDDQLGRFRNLHWLSYHRVVVVGHDALAVPLPSNGGR